MNAEAFMFGKNGSWPFHVHLLGCCIRLDIRNHSTDCTVLTMLILWRSSPATLNRALNSMADNHGQIRISSRALFSSGVCMRSQTAGQESVYHVQWSTSQRG
jgi:hypothetical protein